MAENLIHLIFTSLLVALVTALLAATMIISRKMTALICKLDSIVKLFKNWPQNGNGSTSDSKEKQRPPLPVPDSRCGSQEPEYATAMDQELRITENVSYEPIQ